MDLQGLSIFKSYAGENSEEALNMLMENGFESLHLVHDSNGLNRTRFRKNMSQPRVYSRDKKKKKLEKIASEYDFPLPKDNFFTFHFDLGDAEFDACYMYMPGFSHVLRKSQVSESYSRLVDIAKEFTEITSKDIVMVYDTERFALPKLMRIKKYNNRVITYQTPRLAKQEYNENYEEVDDEEFKKRFKEDLEESADWLLQKKD